MSNTYASEEKGVAVALSKMKMDQGMLTYIQSKSNIWVNFGKMNSHLYREKLMKMFDTANLSAEARFMVFFFFSVIKSQPRILKAMGNMSDDDKAKSWYTEVREFIQANVTQYVTGAKNNLKMPAVNIPSCNPGLDILVFSLITPPNMKTIKNLRNRTTFCQLQLDSEMQKEAEAGYNYYWDEIVKSSRNPDKTEEPKARKDYYETSAADKYLLVGMDLKEIKAPVSGYTQENIEKYLLEQKI